MACPGLHKGVGGGGGGGGGACENLKRLFCFSIFQRGAAQKIADKIIFQTKKVAKYR